MKFFTKNSIGYKIIIAVVIVLLFNFISPTISSADAGGKIGGILFEPVKDLLLVIADSIISVIQSFLFDMDVSFMNIHYEHDGWATAAGIVAGVIGGGAMIITGLAGAPFSGGLSLAAVAAGIKLAVGTIVVSAGAGLLASYVVSNALPQDMQLPMFAISPEEIFRGEVALLDVNFFETADDKGAKPMKLNDEGELVVCDANDEDMKGYYIETTNSTGNKIYQKSGALELKSTISKWYYALRNLAIVALLIILVYVAIRIIISSSAEDKAKYKQRLIDWLVAMCLLFFMHYIMAFAVTFTQEINKAVNSFNSDYGIAIGSSAGDGAEGGKKLSEYVYDDGTEIFGTGETAESLRKAKIIVSGVDENGQDTEYLIWPSNMMGKARIELQLEPKNITENEVLMRKFGYTVIYLALVIYTILFLFRYLKRLMMLTFLTIIAPLMAMTYPLDKMRDGSAQGFNMWLKEYIYNLLIQPVHLILYTVLVGSAMDLVIDNLLYGLVALGFILQAEKLLRRFFGFDKASTVEGGSALGGALAMQGLNMVNKFLGGKNKKGGNGGKGGDGKNKLPTRTKDSGHSTDNLIGQVTGQGDDGGGATPPTLLGGNPLDPSGSGGGSNPSLGGAGGSPIIAPNGLPLVDSSGRPIMSGTNTRRTPPTPPTPPADNRGLGRYAFDWAKNTIPGQFVGKGIRGAGRLAAGTGRTLKAVGKTVATPFVSAGKGVSDFAVAHTSEGLRNAAKNTGRNLSKHAAQLGKTVAYVGPRAAKFAAKTALKGTLAGAGAMTGIAAGLVSDDFSNVIKWGAAGAGGGLVAGAGISGLPERVSGMGDGIVDAAEAEYAATHTPEEIEERQNAIADAQWSHNSETIKAYQEEFGSRKKAKEMMKKAQKYREEGITDDKTIIKAMKMNGFGDDEADPRRMLLAKLATEVDKPKDVEDLEKRLNKRPEFSKDMARDYANAVRKMKDFS